MTEKSLIQLSAAGARADLSLVGAELQSWRVGGQELIWQGDPVHWAQRAPVLFPVIGQSSGGRIRVEGQSFPMPRHGFARDMRFAVVERSSEAATLRLTDSDATRAHYPFAFGLDVVAELWPDRLRMTFEVTNRGSREMPYAVGFHPGFPWPLRGGSKAGHALEFETEEQADVPDITADGLMRSTTRRLPLTGRRLPLEPELFDAGALVLRGIRSRSVRYTSPEGGSLHYAMTGFSNLAVWTKPTAPFVSIEAWTSEPDRDGFDGELIERPSIHLLPPGGSARHAVTMTFGV